jgi:hypothetical protein
MYGVLGADGVASGFATGLATGFATGFVAGFTTGFATGFPTGLEGVVGFVGALLCGGCCCPLLLSLTPLFVEDSVDDSGVVKLFALNG